MKIGMNLLLWTAKPTAREHGPLLAQIKNWGFDGVEFPIAGMEPADVREMARRCDDLGLGRTAIVALGAAQHDPINPDAALRQAAVTELKRCCDVTRELGAELLCGPIFQGLGRFSGVGPTPDEWGHAQQVLREVGQYAAQSHLKLALEPLNRFEMYLVNTVGDGARFCRELNLPNVGLLADTHHSNIEEERPATAWAAVAPHIFHVHLSENHRGIPGSGHAIGMEMFRMLRSVNYDGWLTIEAFGLQVPDLIPRLHLWRPYFQREEDVAVQGCRYIRQCWDRAGQA